MVSPARRWRGANQHTYNFLSIKHEANSWLVRGDPSTPWQSVRVC